jgi:transketolase
MRATLDKFLSKYNNPDLIFLHADMWSFDRFKARHPERCMNFGIQETNMVNVAGGLASQGKSVIIYGVAGFVYQRGYEQLKFSVVNFGSSVTFINAGHNGCYERCGIGHLPDDDYKLMNALNVKCHEPTTRSEFLNTLTQCIRDSDTNFIRLGWDGCEW